jgi:D-alanyl-D-alanine carboxypeptidase (penicillin-binding protein 5/6)
MKLLSKKHNFLFLCLLSFVFVASTALALNSRIILPSSNVEKTANLTSYPPLPVLNQSVSFPVLSAQAALAVDLDSGVSLYEKDPNKPLLPASTTKIMTALVALENYSEDQVLGVSDTKVEGQTMGLKKGEQITVRDLLYGLLVYSANDAAEVLAKSFQGGRDAFVAAMNEKAKELSLTNTKFTNPSGLDGDGHVSTARDLIRISEVAMENPEFAKIVGTKTQVVRSVDGKIAHYLTNINELLGKIPGVLGVKTGWTENARENLVTYVNRDNHKVMIAVLGSQDRFGETKELIDWIYSNYSWQEVRLPN